MLRVSVLDHHLDLDVTAPAHQEVLRGQLTGRHAPLVQESPLSDPELLGWSAGHVTEVVVPLLPVRPRPAAPRTPAPATARVRHAPGGEWLYAKLCTRPATGSTPCSSGICPRCWSGPARTWTAGSSSGTSTPHPICGCVCTVRRTRCGDAC
ncbi:hypothetical protein ACWV95_34895 [Streptomyces albus]